MRPVFQVRLQSFKVGEIYKLAISRFNLIPEETLFIDDKKENIEAAKKLGFLTIHLTDPEIIIHEINRFI